jgi:hypothetical protein
VRSLLRRLRTPRTAALAGAALVALAGLALVLLGIAHSTVWAPETVTVARVPGQAGAPLVVTTDAATALDGPSDSGQAARSGSLARRTATRPTAPSLPSSSRHAMGALATVAS